MKYNQWNYRCAPVPAVEALEAAHISPLAARVLAARGWDTPEKARQFLNTDPSLLLDPFLLRDMEQAVARIRQALEAGELICVYGDYDVDGITSTCLLTSFLLEQGGRVVPYVPNRLTEGYSLNPAALDLLAGQGVTLIVTVDCGITSLEEVEYARQLGMEVVITDHHECKDTLPQAAAVVNPHRPDGNYPAPVLAGVGVALKLVLALTPPRHRATQLRRSSDLAAIGTVADVMDLRGENRAIVALGLQQLQRCPRPGLTALLREAGQENRQLTAATISFSLAPRINASGRMGCPQLAVQLLLTRDPGEAELLARQLCALNRDRQEVELNIYQQCEDFLHTHPAYARDAIVLASPQWHQGVVGIVSSRLSEQFQVPSFMICLEGDKGKGSCRSWGRFDLFHALEACSDLLEGFGGHELAAGFTIHKDHIPAFRQRMGALARQWQSGRPVENALTVDAAISDPKLLTRENVQALGALEPHGTGNPTPVFVLERATVVSFTRVGGGRHTRLQLRKGGVTFDAIFFSTTPKDAQLTVGAKLDVAFHLQINEFRGNQSVQLQLADCRPSRSLAAQSQQLYRQYRSGMPLSAADLARLIPERPDFVAVWRYLTRQAQGGRLRESSVKLSQKIARSCGRQEDLGRTMVCLEVFHERGLIELTRTADTLTITIHKTDQKVDLEASEVLIHLRRQRAD